MTRAARSIYVFGIYLIVMGGLLVASPNTVLALLHLPSTEEPWIHVLGVPVVAIGMFHVASARAELVPFFRTSVVVRVFVLMTFGAMAALRIVPPVVIGFGLVDAAGALWTHRTMTQTGVAVAVEDAG